MEKIYKDEKNKARIDLVDPEFIVGIAEILGYGVEKYEPYSFQKVAEGLDKYYAAAMRHILKWRTGDFEDEETGKNHLLHAACNLMFMCRIQHQEVIGPLMSVTKLHKIWEKTNGSNGIVEQPEATTVSEPGREADNGEDSSGAVDTRQSEVFMARRAQERIRALCCLVPDFGGNEIIHGPNTDPPAG